MLRVCTTMNVVELLASLAKDRMSLVAKVVADAASNQLLSASVDNF